MRHTITRLALLALTTACSSGGGGKLSLSTRAVGAATSSTSGTAAGLALENGVTITKIRMVVRKISLEREGDCSADQTRTPTPATSLGLAALSSGSSRGSDDVGTSPDDSSDHSSGPDDSGSPDDDACEVKAGPAYVEIGADALSGAVKWAFDVPIPEGTYDELAIKIDTVPDGKATSDGLRSMAAAHASIVVNGTLDAGTETARDFEFKTPMAVTQAREGQITIGQGSNVTLEFDPSGWFGPTGARLDPTDTTNQGAILANIRSSLRILHDDDADGREDGHEDGASSR
jgi:hypothetical protein